MPTTITKALRENAALLLMYALGAALAGLLWLPLGLLYIAYAVLANIIYMAWVCPYCQHYARGDCPAGYDLLSGRRFQARLGKTYRGQFLRGVLVLAGGWFLPPLIGAALSIRDFSWWLLALTALFCLVAFVVLPADSQRHCRGCDNLDCPRYKGVKTS